MFVYQMVHYGLLEGTYHRSTSLFHIISFHEWSSVKPYSTISIFNNIQKYSTVFNNSTMLNNVQQCQTLVLREPIFGCSNSDQKRNHFLNGRLRTPWFPGRTTPMQFVKLVARGRIRTAISSSIITIVNIQSSIIINHHHCYNSRSVKI